MSDNEQAYQDAMAIFQRSSVLISEQEVDQAIDTMANRINQDYHGKTPLVLCVMNGGLATTAKLVSKLNMALQMDYIHATRYGDETTGQNLNWIAMPKTSLAGRDVILVDDILDEGITLQSLFSYCQEENVASVKAALLVSKDHGRCVAPELGHYVGLSVPDKFIFGCGMDYKGFFRNLPAIYAVNEA